MDIELLFHIKQFDNVFFISGRFWYCKHTKLSAIDHLPQTQETPGQDKFKGNVFKRLSNTVYNSSCLLLYLNSHSFKCR